jgi:hypothetical protein
MHDGIVSPSDIERVAVGQKRQTAELFDFFGETFDPLRTKIRQIAGFAEMYLDSNVLVLEIDAIKTGFGDNPFQFRQQRIAVFTAHIRPIDLCRHGCYFALRISMPVILHKIA